MRNGFTFNEVHSSDLGVVVDRIIRPLKAEKRKSIVVIPNKSGVYEFQDKIYNNIIVEVECGLSADSKEDLRESARKISHWLSKKGKLIFDDEKDKYYIGEVDTSTILNQLRRMGKFVLMFNCNPFAYSDIPTIKKTFTDNGAILINNNGAFETSPRFIIDGTATSVTITSPKGAFSIANITEKVYVDCERMICYTVDVNGNKVNKMLDLTGDFFSVEEGTTRLDITITGTTPNVILSVDVKEKYL